MANLTVNQWLQDAVEKACVEHVKALLKDEAGTASITTTVTPMYNGIEVAASFTKNGDREFRPVWFTAKEAFEVFMERKEE